MGPLPWLMLAGWGLWAGLQEPVILRSYRLDLLYQGAWLAGFALLIPLLLSTRYPTISLTAALSSNLALLLVVALFQGGMAIAVDQLQDGHRSAVTAQLSTATFVLAAGPVAAALATGRIVSQTTTRKILTSSVFVMSPALAESYWTRGVCPVNLLGSGLLFAAAVLLAAAP